MELNQTTFGSVAEYVCNEGFIILGNTSDRSCQANGRWTEQPICIGKIIIIIMSLLRFISPRHAQFVP